MLIVFNTLSRAEAMENHNLSINLTAINKASATLIQVSFENKSETAYFLDKKLAFLNNRYYMDCLKLTQNGIPLKRLKRVKFSASEFPDDFFKIIPGTTLYAELELKNNFLIPEPGTILVQYDGLNMNPISNNIDPIKSNIIEIAL